MSAQKGKTAGNKRNTKQKLVSRTSEMLLTHGFDNFTLHDLLTSIDVGVGTFYYYFESKEDLLVEGFIYNDKKFVSNFKKKYAKIDSCADKLLLFMQEQAMYTFKMTDEYLKNYRHVIRHKMSTYYFDLRLSPKYQLLYEIIEEGQTRGEFTVATPATLLAEMFWTMMAGCADFARMCPTYDIVQHVEQLSVHTVNTILTPECAQAVVQPNK